MPTRIRSWIVLSILHRQRGEGVEIGFVMRKPRPHPDADECEYHEHGKDAGDMPPERTHFGGSFGSLATPSPWRYATSASSSVLSATALGAPSMSASVYGSPSLRST